MSTFYGQIPLGYKTSSPQQDSLLGDEWDTTAMTYDAATDMWVSTNSGRVRVKWVENNSGAALAPGSAVTRDHATGKGDIEVEACTNLTVPCGIVDPYLKSNVANGEKFLIVTKAERIPALAGAAVVAGAGLGVLANGKLDDAAPTDKMVALELASGDAVMFDIACNFYAL